jgi:hypothetical protein
LATTQNFALKKGCRHVVGSSFSGGELSQLRECFSENEKEMKIFMNFRYLFHPFSKNY